MTLMLPLEFYLSNNDSNQKPQSNSTAITDYDSLTMTQIQKKNRRQIRQLSQTMSLIKLNLDGRQIVAMQAVQ
jgi:hypothetical protein